jgi:hypothetical protein
MNGWMRLWIFMSVIWAVIVVSVTAWIVIEDAQQSAEGPWIKYSLNDESRSFYEGLEGDEKGPAYTIAFEYEDGTEQNIQFTLIDRKVSEIDFKGKLNELAQEEGKELSPHEIESFIEQVSAKNAQALKAKNAFDAAVEFEKARKVEKRKETIYMALTILVVPSLLFLLIGLGFGVDSRKMHNKWVKPTGATLRSVPAAYPRRYIPISKDRAWPI